MSINVNILFFFLTASLREKRPKYSSPAKPATDDPRIKLKLQNSFKVQEKNILAQLNNYNNVFMQKVICSSSLMMFLIYCYFSGETQSTRNV